jgi:hypothetical protein
LPARKPRDIVLVHSPTADGSGVNVLRAREQRLEVGTMRPLEEGRPLHGEVVKLTARPEQPYLFDAETQFASPEATRSGSDVAGPRASAELRGTAVGPAQVASDSYRKNWDTIWKRPGKPLSN